MSHYQFNVKMSCSGCSNAVNRALSRREENSNIKISLEDQTVDLDSTLSFEEVEAAIKKTGKEVVSGKVV